MLQLCDIVKDYISGDTTVHALKGVSLTFRSNEFVSILGHSGCGKTTMLNIVGGLDQYTSGDLVINGISTKRYKDRDWDNYRNHSIGFVFQSYNLIPHQTVIGNVELALTLSGVTRAERHEMAKAALIKVGLGEQLNKRPNQLSGGQMQRVAIARALVNNPEIILADEPTGALDTETSVQIMDLLKEVARDRLVIMVTHNPDLAMQYSTRIVKLKDGEIVDDTDPYFGDDAQVEKVADEINDASTLENAQVAAGVEESTDEPIKSKNKDKRKLRKPHMSPLTAFSLSIRNLFTKKGRTFLTAFAGSIGIIGIALILSLSNGFNGYIKRIETETLSAYPITINETSVSTDALMNAMNQKGGTGKAYSDVKKVYSNDVLGTLIGDLFGEINHNDLKSFKAWLEANPEKTSDILTAIQYEYTTQFEIYKGDYAKYGTGAYKISNQGKLYPFELPASVQHAFGGGNDAMSSSMDMMMNSITIWQEMIDNAQVLNEQYDVIEGTWPKLHESTDGNVYEVVLSVDKYNCIPDYLLCAIGLKDVEKIFNPLLVDKKSSSYDFEKLIGMEFKILSSAEKYSLEDGKWVDKCSESNSAMSALLSNAITIKVSGIVRPKQDGNASLLQGAICYTKELTNAIIDRTDVAPVVIAQRANENINVFTGEAFTDDISVVDNYLSLGAVSKDSPSTIYLFAAGFHEKEQLAKVIKEYNSSVSEDKQIKYTDMVATLMGSVSSIVNAVSYVLIAFVSISLVVSSIMIGIITYISVLERTKEIGVLRSIGASKRDISRLFNAETVTIGFMSGMFGIIITLLLNIPINIIIKKLTGIGGLAALPVLGAVALVLISMFLTFIAGFVPAKIAAKKDPVVALRTE